MAMAACSILPSDCWELIFNRVENFEAISLVCKDFLSLSNTFRRSLKVYSSSIELLSRLLKRFRCLKKIDLSDFHGDMDEAVFEIARSGLQLKSLNIYKCRKFPIESLKELGSYMKSLKTLNCSYIFGLKDDCLIQIVNSLPWLEGIHITSWHTNITEDGIVMLVKGLPNLKKLELSGDFELSERFILALSSSCPFLKKIKLYCNCRTRNWFNQLFRLFPNLVSISAPSSLIDFSQLTFVIENSINNAKNLHELEFVSASISDNTLGAIANAHLPLKVVNLNYCKSYSIAGLSTLLRAYPSLKVLNLTGAKFVRDEDISSLVPYLRELTSIYLSECTSLTVSTLFTLLKTCPLLVEIDMNCTGLGKEQEDLGTELTENHQLQTLRLSNEYRSIDDLLKKIGARCPNLQLLDVACCSYLTNDGIEEILKCCKKIKHLELGAHNGRKIFREDTELSGLSLEVLKVVNIDDANMALVAKRCPGLRELELFESPKVTNKGVTALVENCTKLREINLEACDDVTADILPLMVTSIPSLKIIHLPYDSIPIEENDLYVVYDDGSLITKR